MKFKYVKKFEGGGAIKDFIKSDAYNKTQIMSCKNMRYV